MTEELSFPEMLEGLRNGDPIVVTRVHEKFAHRLIALASRQFEARLRVKADPEEVIQSVYLSFLKRMKSSNYELADWGGLWSLLVVITIRKCQKRHRFWRATRRDYTAEVDGFDVLQANPARSEFDRQPTPLEGLMLAEIWDRLIERLDPLDRLIAELAFQGDTRVEIALACDCSERMVYRALRRIREELIELDLLNGID